MKHIKLLMFGGLLTLASCFSGNNPKFNCLGLGCSEPSTTGTQPTLAPLSFLETLEQGYWYSRYNLGHLVMRSGNGETFMPQMQLVEKMVEMVSDEASQANPPKNPALIKRVYNSANPSFKPKLNDDPMDFTNFRWMEVKSEEKTTGQSFGWTLMKEVEWSKLFNVDSHFGIPKKNDVPAAQQRFSGLVLCAQSIVQADTFINDFNGERKYFDLTKNSDQYLAFMAIANLANYLETASIPGIMEDNRCRKVAALMKGKSADAVADDYKNFLLDFEFELIPPESIKEKSLFVQAYAYYSKLLADKKLYKFATSDILGKLKEVDYSERSLTDKAYALRALLDGHRILGESSYLTKSQDLWEKIKNDFSLETSTFKSQQTYTTEDVAILFSALNALKLFGGPDLEYFYVIQTFIKSFDTLVNQSGLQISAPPIEFISQWERKAENLHRSADLPFPRAAGGENGRAPVFASTITFNTDSGRWTSTPDKFNTSGAMNLANQMVWFHYTEVSGFPCPDQSCATPRALTNADLIPPGTPTGNDDGGGSIGGPVLTFNQLHSQIITRCIACHAGAGAPMGLDMSTPDKAYENLVGKPAVQGSAFGGVNRVTPGNSDPSASYIIAKLQFKNDDRIGDRMPRGGPYLSEGEIEQVKAWIEAGANR